jgi:hypothetical protein
LESETALPTGDTAAAGEQAQTPAAASTEQTGQEQQGQESQAKPESEEGGDKDAPKKPEKDPKDREIERLRRRVDNITRRRYELEAQLGQRPAQPAGQQQTPQASNDEPVTLTRAELDRMIAERAQGLAPALTEQRAEAEKRQAVVTKLAKEWGQEEFDAKASELDEVFGGLKDARGEPKAATQALFEADDPKAVIEYLTDPDNAEEAERIAGMSAVRAGRAITLIEQKLAAAKKEAKPQPSKAAKPLEAVKGGGVPSGAPDPADTKAWIRWSNEQERAARR